MNKHERAEIVRAMDKIAYLVNDEEVFCSCWLSVGVADGDITPETTDEELEWYCEDENFADLMNTFLRLMSRAYKGGGLYADRVLSEGKV